MRPDFGILILTHGRPDGVATTLDALRKGGYTGKWWLVLDDEDETRDQYAARWGQDRILAFNKDTVAASHDLADNGGPRGVVFYARNAAPALAADLGLSYFMQADDDYTYFAHRHPRDGKLVYTLTSHLDDVLEAFIGLLDDTGALTVALAQAGDLLGGIQGDYTNRPYLRKAMNTFICRTARPLSFHGRINEDVTTYVLLGSRGELFLTVTDFAIDQRQTQTQEGGMTGAYLGGGTYRKSFYTVMHAPSCTRIATMGKTEQRIHHQITWGRAVPKILPGRYRKAAPL